MFFFWKSSNYCLYFKNVPSGKENASWKSTEVIIMLFKSIYLLMVWIKFQIEVKQRHTSHYFFYFLFRPLTAEEIALRREKIRMRAAKSPEDAENEKDQDNLPKSDESDGLLLYIKSVDNTKNIGAQCLLIWKKLLINMKKNI